MQECGINDCDSELGTDINDSDDPEKEIRDYPSLEKDNFRTPLKCYTKYRTGQSMDENIDYLFDLDPYGRGPDLDNSITKICIMNIQKVMSISGFNGQKMER